MTSISANLRTCERAVIFQVTDQSDSVDKFLNKGAFIATNGWMVTKSVCPEIDVLGKVIFLRGASFDKRRRVSRNWNLSSDVYAEKIVKQIDNALKEFVNVAENNARMHTRIGHSYHNPFDFSTPESYSTSNRTNYSSNRPTITA